jgi:glycine/D-amino acid oxidase-like deaminating enzyme
LSSADYRALSFWMSTVDDDLTPRPSLGGSIDVDIAIVGAGYTGLWTAYYLAVADPSLRIAVLEAETAGFGASGRNGGWCSALFPLSVPSLARRYGRERAVALQRAMHDTVDEVGRVAAAEGIDCHFAKGGMVALARTPVQLDRARSEVAEAREFGFGSEDLVLLEAEEARAHCGATDVLGGTFSVHCAAIDPARLVRGLARAVERRGVTIYERTPALALTSRTVETGHGTVRADVVVRATEGYTPRLRGLRRAVAPVYSLMIATEPLPSSFWASVGLRARETFTDYRHLIIYGQRTADDRLAFGGRGAPYHFGSSIRPSFDRDPRVHRELVEVLRELFPAIGDPVIGDPPITHAWGGPLGVPRDWCASVRFDRSTGIASAGGYVGDGVGTSNLAGRTLADLITGTSSDLVRLPWVGHRSPNWEPEPLRWLGVNAGLRLMTSADAAEGRTGHPSKRAALFGRLIGG